MPAIRHGGVCGSRTMHDAPRIRIPHTATRLTAAHARRAGRTTQSMATLIIFYQLNIPISARSTSLMPCELRAL